MEFQASPFELPCSSSEIDLFLSQPTDAAVDSLRGLWGDVVVLGAGGKMGLHLCLLLKQAFTKLGQSNEVIAVSRFGNLKARSEYEDRGVKTLAGDLLDEGFVQSLPEVPTVFYLVGAKFGTSDNPEILQQINVDLAESLATKYSKSRIVAFSTGCVYSYVTPESGGSHEGSPVNPVGEYAISCLGREQKFEEVSAKCDTPVVLIRLNYSVEFRYGVLVDICSKVMAGEEVDLSTGYVNVIWQNDALNQIVQSIAMAQVPALPLNIAGADLMSVQDLAARFGQLLGKEPSFSGEEKSTAWLSNAGRSHRLFGEPRTSTDQMIEWIVAWLTSGGSTYGKPTGFEKQDGKF